MSIALINNILSIKYGVSITLDPEPNIVMNPADIINFGKFMKDNPTKTLADYIPIYEAIEIRSDNKVYDHILKNSVDTSNPYFLQFETDTDLNTSTMVLGAPSAKTVKYNGVLGTVRRRIIIDYKSVDSVDYVRIKPL